MRRKEEGLSWLTYLWSAVIVLGLMLALSGCAPNAPPPEVAASEPTTEAADCPEPEPCEECPDCPECPPCPAPTEAAEASAEASAEEAVEFTPISEHEDVYAMWAESPHGNTYDEGKGPNTYCSRCHSPQNWDPLAHPDNPPNCVTCKFPTDEELRIAETMDFVPEEEWVGIACDTCHMVEGDMIDTTQNYWYDVMAEEYVPVRDVNELCAMCHVNSTGVSTTGGRGVDHQIILGGSAHTDWAASGTVDRPDTCTACHNPHSQQPKTCLDCHEDVTTLETHAKGMNDIHLEEVQCIACHDASGAEVGPHPNEEMNGVFTTLLTSMSRSGEPTVEAITSHSVQWEVACNRCHFEENPWELPVLTETGEEPAEG